MKEANEFKYTFMISIVLENKRYRYTTQLFVYCYIEWFFMYFLIHAFVSGQLVQCSLDVLLRRVKTSELVSASKHYISLFYLYLCLNIYCDIPLINIFFKFLKTFLMNLHK
jgi:hypothetical protein